MDKRIAAVAGGLALIGMIVAPAPARADFHSTTQACPGSVGSAQVALEEANGTFTFRGSVRCPGATSVTITSVTFNATPTNGVKAFGQQVVPPAATTTAGPASCGPCDGTWLEVKGTAPSAPGSYAVTMRFTATGPGGTFTPSRKAVFLWPGVGQPIVYCTQNSCGQLG